MTKATATAWLPDSDAIHTHTELYVHISAIYF